MVKKPAKAKTAKAKTAKAAKLKRERKLDDLYKFKPGELDKLTLGDFKLGARRIPLSELTPEERRNLEGFAREEERWRQRQKEQGGGFDWAKAGRKLDRAMMEESRGRLPPLSPPASVKKTKKSKARRPPGRPPHPPSVREGVEKVARDILYVTKQMAFEAAVRLELERQGKTVPGQTYLTEWTSPIHNQRKTQQEKTQKPKN